jgi:putative SOS response-associated peptidase YedK
MCGRYAVTLPPEAMRNIFKTLNLLEYPPRYNIAPTQPIVAIWEDGGRRESRLARWGLVPHWVKDPREFPLLVNARAETMAQKPAFRDAVKHGRCVVPASGYYEWHTGSDGKKQPYYITLENGDPIAMAGLYATWMGPEGEEIDSVATITVPAGPDVTYIHDRMPAILVGDAIESWLDVRGTRFDEIAANIAPQPAGMMASRPVSRRVNSAANDGPDLLDPVTEAEPAEDKKHLKVKKKASGQLDLF